MENESKGRGRSRKSAAPQEPQTIQAAAIVGETPAQVLEPPKLSKPVTPKEIDPDQYVSVRNGYQGKLIYKSKHTGEVFVWESFGDEQDMELSELKRARSASKKYFQNNWFMFDDPWIVDYLGMGQYYKFAISIKDFDKVFDLSADEIEETVSKLSAGQKKSVAYRARQLIADGKIDSNRAIAALEKSLGVELIER